MNSKVDPVSWQEVCSVNDVVPGTGVAARIHGQQVALFHTDDGFFAIDNQDPFSQANVLARGIVGDLQGTLVVASPVYKQHFCLRTGACLEDTTVTLPTWPVRVRDDRVLIAHSVKEV